MASSCCCTLVAVRTARINFTRTLASCWTCSPAKATNLCAWTSCLGRALDREMKFPIPTKLSRAFCGRLGAFLVSLMLRPFGHADEIFIRANQVGFAPREVKVGIAFSAKTLPKDFSLADAVSGRVLFHGKTKER